MAGIVAESLFLIPACLQPRRIIDRVRGFVGGGRPSATTTKKRLREQVGGSTWEPLSH